MLKKSFVHIKGVSKEKEQQFWQEGIGSWEDLISKSGDLSFSFSDKVRDEVMQSLKAYERQDFSYFAGRMPKNQHWRMYNELKGKCCFLDIETSGLSKTRDIITIIGIYDGKESKVFVEGKNMHLFPKELAKYDMVVTFNGACFDLPFIRSKYNGLQMPAFHVDLRYPLRTLGYSGGLKLIEKSFGFERDESIADVDGFEAIRLWKAYQKGDKNALAKLIDYNIADIENLKPMMDFVFEKLSSS
jgi:uncharacterized protein